MWAFESVNKKTYNLLNAQLPYGNFILGYSYYILYVTHKYIVIISKGVLRRHIETWDGKVGRWDGAS